MASSSYFTNDEIKLRILTVYPQFVSDVDSDRLSDYLVQGYVITIDQWQRIRHENPAKPERCRALLSHLFYTQHPRAFLVVLQALKKENHYILEFIESQESGCGFGVQHDKQPVLQDKNKIQQLQNDNEDQKRAWEADKDRLLKMQKENEDQKRAWEEEKDRLLKKQKDLKTKLHLEKNKIQQLEEDYNAQKTEWEAEKDRILKIQNQPDTKLHLDKTKLHQLEKDYEYQKISWEAEKDRLLKIQKDLEIELHLKNLQTKYKSDPGLVLTIVTKAAKRRKAICGFAILDKEIFAVSYTSPFVEVYESKKFSFSRRWNSKELVFPCGIGSCNRNKCLYIFDDKGFDQPKEILRVDSNGKLITKWSTENNSGRLSVTDDSNIIFTVFETDKINEYSPDGQLVREIYLSSDAGFSSLRHAIKLTNGDFLVSHGFDDDDALHRVCVVDADGKLKKSFGGKPGSTIGQMNEPIYLSVDRYGFVMVADRRNSRILLLDSDLEFKQEILSKEKDGLRYPQSIHLNESNGRLFVADNELYSENDIFTDGRILILL